MTELFKAVVGSNLFGTTTPRSDTDTITIVTPTARQVLLGNARFSHINSTSTKTAKNGPDDVDETVHSISKFVYLLTQMDFTAIETLFAPSIIEASPQYQLLVDNRFRILNTGKPTFYGYGKDRRKHFQSPLKLKLQYHAQRVVDEGIELYSTGEIKFPLKNATYYQKMRLGEVSSEEALERYDETLDALSTIIPIADFHEKSDWEWIDDFIAKVHERTVIDGYVKISA